MIEIHCDHPELKDEFEQKLSANPDFDKFEIINDEGTLMIFGGDHNDQFFICQTWSEIKAKHGIDVNE